MLFTIKRLAACDLLDSCWDFNGGGDVLMVCDVCNKELPGNKTFFKVIDTNYCPECYEAFSKQANKLDLSQVSDKDLFEEYNRRAWKQMDKARLEYELKGKPVMD
jgi:ribosome-binding protein aMBF1 (putative translation factor)